MEEFAVFTLIYGFVLFLGVLFYRLDIKWRAKRIASEMERVLRELIEEQKNNQNN